MSGRSLATASCVALLLGALPARGCESPDSYSFSILSSLPAASNGESVVARVEIIGLETRPGRRSYPQTAARVRVVEAIRGVAEGRELVVRSFEPHMCVELFDRSDIGRRGYIAGAIDPASGAFRGAWRGGVRVD